MITAREISEYMRGLGLEEQREILSRFFKTGKGQYGEGDLFYGIKVPVTRSVVKEIKGDVTPEEIGKLLESPVHEERLCAFLLLVEEMKSALPRRGADTRANASRRAEIAGFYLAHAHRANNWDFVDLSCPYIVGEWMLHPLADGTMPDRRLLDRLADSDNLWEQRIAIVSTMTLTRAGQTDDALRIAERLLNHSHDLIHKAVGWQLREVGKRDVDRLRQFLDRFAATMPRTALRYAIEKMDAAEKRYWMDKKYEKI